MAGDRMRVRYDVHPQTAQLATKRFFFVHYVRYHVKSSNKLIYLAGKLRIKTPLIKGHWQGSSVLYMTFRILICSQHLSIIYTCTLIASLLCLISVLV